MRQIILWLNHKIFYRIGGFTSLLSQFWHCQPIIKWDFSDGLYKLCFSSASWIVHLFIFNSVDITVWRKLRRYVLFFLLRLSFRHNQFYRIMPAAMVWTYHHHPTFFTPKLMLSIIERLSHIECPTIRTIDLNSGWIFFWHYGFLLFHRKQKTSLKHLFKQTSVLGCIYVCVANREFTFRSADYLIQSKAFFNRSLILSIR